MLPGDLEFCSVSSSNVILWRNSNRNDLCLQCSFYASACLPYFFKLPRNYTDILFDMLSTAFIPFWCSWAAREQFQTDVRRWKVCLELHSCSSWPCFHQVFDILLDIPVYFNCCFGYGVGCKSVFSSRWFNQSSCWPLPLTLWLEFYMVIIMHACIHWQCCSYFYWSVKDQQRVLAVDQELLWVWRVKQTHRIKPRWAFSLQQVVERKKGKAITSLSAEPNMDYCRICKMGLANVFQVGRSGEDLMPTT